MRYNNWQIANRIPQDFIEGIIMNRDETGIAGDKILIAFVFFIVGCLLTEGIQIILTKETVTESDSVIHETAPSNTLLKESRESLFNTSRWGYDLVGGVSLLVVYIGFLQICKRWNE